MTKQEFVEQIKAKFEETGDFDIFNCGDVDDSLEIIIPSVDVAISFNDDSTFNIYRSFCYPIRDYAENFENEHRAAQQEKTSKHLVSFFKEAFGEEFDFGMGCPYDSVLVGFWRKQFDINFIDSFVNVCEEADTEISDDDVSKLIMESISEVSKKFRLKSLNESCYTSEHGEIIVFSKDIKSIGLDNIDLSTLASVELPVFAARYFCGKKPSGEVIVTDTKKIRKFFDICNHFNVDTSDFDFFCVENEYLYIKGSLNAIISLEANPDDKVDNEYSLLASKLNTLAKIKPQTNVNPLDFSHLTYEQFEQLCYELLNKQGFIQVHPVGNSNAPDGGKDIIATEEYKTMIGVEHRKWIWQCKHSKQSLNRKDIAEIGDLLQENSASAYGLFCSNSLTPDAINRLEMKRSANTVIMYYGKIELGNLLSHYPDLLERFKLLGGKSK